MKYESIHNAVKLIPKESTVDMSSTSHGLWLIIESKYHNKRIWITHSFNQTLEVTTVQLDLDCKSKEYTNSYERHTFKTVRQMAKFIREKFIPGLNDDDHCEFYFNQYWACTNPQIFSSNEMRITLRKIWIECWKFLDCDRKIKPEDWLEYLGDFYKQRILLGKRVYDPPKPKKEKP